MINKDTILNDVKNVITIINRIPSMREYNKLGKFHTNTILKKFGKWNTFLLENFGKTFSFPKTQPKTTTCLCCKQQTTNPKFCSQSCAAKYNNIIFPKRKKSPKTKFLCQSCKKELTLRKSKQCIKCHTLFFLNKFGQKILGDFKSTFARHKYQNIRNHAKRIAKFNNLEKKCKTCGYTTNVDLCHIKQIYDFPKNSKVSEINSLNNLVYLCKNHHWEMDHKLLNITECQTGIEPA